MNDLPKYGALSARYLDDLKRKSLRLPIDWHMDATDPETRVAAWKSWRREIIVSLDALWPAFGRDTTATAGVRQQQRVALTRRDLDLMHDDFVDCMAKRVTSAQAIDEREHWELYAKEDVLDGPGDMSDTLLFYAPGLACELDHAFAGSFATGRARKLGSLLLQLKLKFERPRAYQTAVLLYPGREFAYEYAATASTPSFVSGHCLQALLSTAYFHERLARGSTAVTPSTVAALEQFAADVGDRRVFAGVHYPSDSLGSWLVAVSLVRHVFVPSSVDLASTFVCNAIRRSFVYQRLSSETDANIARAMRTLNVQMES